MKPLVLSGLLLASAVVHAQTAATSAAIVWTGGKIPMVFSNTDVGHALKAIGLRTGSDIVFAAGKDKAEITLSVVASSPDEAIRCVASAAGLVVRRVNRLFVVAPPAGMRQALEPYAIACSFPVEDGAPADLAARLQETLPYASVRATGDRVSVVAIPDELEFARATLKDLQAGSAGRRPATDVVLLERAVPATVAPLLAALFPDVKVVPTPGDRPGGALALSGPQAGIDGARSMAGKLDAESGANGVVFKVYNVRYSSAPALADFLKQAAPGVEAFAGPEAHQPKRAAFNPITESASFFGGGGSTSGATPALGGASGASAPGVSAPGGDTTGEKAKTLVVRGREADVTAAMALLAQVDRKPRQVVVEVNVIETSPQNDSDVGLLYDWQPFNFVEAAPGASALSRRPVGVGQFSRTPLDFTAILNAKVVKKEARILAKPRIQVVDNGQASVFVGDTIRARIVSQGALGSQTVEIQSFPVGIILLIAPRVNADGNITMHVNPVVSTVTAIDGNNVPQTSVREAETTAIVRSGETVVLGGLIRDDDVKTVQEIPFLSKLPLVGELFRNRSRNHRRTDVLVSITPRLIEDEPEVKP